MLCSACRRCERKYERNFTPLRKCTIELLAWCLAELPAGTPLRVLEVGPGVRNMRRYFESRGMLWHGVDPRYTTDEARRRYHGLASAMPMFPPASFDCAVASNSMEHWGNRGSGLAAGLLEIWRVLRPGGVFYSATPVYSHGTEPFLSNDQPAMLAAFGDGWAVEMDDWGDPRAEHMLYIRARRLP